nr:integrase, catalytic region, zinc finger, CCHC-type, peptidase aspartic, catalytic [Tanacetum cinerariifolium]
MIQPEPEGSTQGYPLVSVEVLRCDKRSKSENMEIVPTKMELILEHTQQGISHEVSETNTFDNSLLEFETFCFEVEKISSSSCTTHFDISLPEYKAFYDDHVKEISSGSTTTHSDSSLYDSLIFDLSINLFPPDDRTDFYEFVDELTHIISPPGYDCFCLKLEPDSEDFTKDVVEDISLLAVILLKSGSECRPHMLNKENYVPWSSRLLRYAKSRPNGKLIHNSILNGPCVRKMIPELGDANREITVTETFHLHLKESVEKIHDIVEEAKVVRPLDRSIVSACRYTQHSQELLEYAIGTCPQGSQQRAKQLAHTPLIRKKQDNVTKPFNRQDRVNVAPKLADHSLRAITRPIGSRPLKVVQIVLWYSDSGCSKHMTGDRSRFLNFVKKFIGTVRFGNDHFGAIMGYDDYVVDTMTDVTAPTGQAPTMALLVHSNDQCLPRIRWVQTGYLKFSAKGTKREVFGMPVPGSLITADLQEVSYYQEYLANVVKHRWFLSGEPARKPDPTAQKVRIHILQYLIYLRMCKDVPTKMMKMFLLVENLR